MARRASGAWDRTAGRAREHADAATAVLVGAPATTDGQDLALAMTGIAASEAELLAVLSDPASSPSDLASACEALTAVIDLQADLRRRELSVRFRALDRIHEAVARLGRTATVRQLVEAVPAELCTVGRFDRAMISQLRGSTWIPRRLHVEEERHPTNVAFQDFSQRAEITLTSTMPEAELVHRRTPTLVRDRETLARVTQPMLEVSQCSGYVAAPIITSTGVIGFLHADAFSSGRWLEPADRDHVRTFADGLALVFERAVAAERVEVQRRRVRAAFTSAECRVRDLRDAGIAFPGPPVTDSADADRGFGGSPPVHAAQLTGREREILSRLASGASNRQIAEELVIATSTVKSHVKNIMRKLGAATRSEAVSRYLRQGMARSTYPSA